jgi:hypothetical protein
MKSKCPYCRVRINTRTRIRKIFSFAFFCEHCGNSLDVSERISYSNLVLATLGAFLLIEHFFNIDSVIVFIFAICVGMFCAKILDLFFPFKKE